VLYLGQQAGLTAAFLILAYLTGWAWERACLRRVPLGPLRPLARWCLGFATWMAAVFGLAATGLLGSRSLLVLALGVLLVTGLLRRHRGGRRFPWPLRWPMAVALGLLLLPDALLALSPQMSWDAAVYHLTLPRLFLEHGGFRPVPFLVYAHWPANGEMLYTAVLGFGEQVGLGASGSYPAAKLLHFAFGLLTAYALAVAVTGARRRRATPWLAPLVLALFLANPVVLEALRVAYVELIQAFFLTAGVLFLDRGLRRTGTPLPRPGGRAALVLAGLCGGVLAGLKVSGFLTTGVLAIVLLGAAGRRLGGPRRGSGRLPGVLGALAWFGGPALILALPWGIRCWAETGNPVYPFLYGVFGGPHWSPELGARFAAWQQGIGMGREALDYLLLLPRVILQGGHGYDHFDGAVGTFWLLLLPLSLILAARRRLTSASRLGLGVSALVFLLWAASSQQTRFLVLLLPLLALAAGEALVCLTRGTRHGSRILPLVTGLAVLGVAVLHGSTLATGYRTLAIYGRQTPTAILASGEPPIFRFMDQRLPPQARVLMLHTNRGFFCRREYLADSFFEASQIAQWLKTPEAADIDDMANIGQRLRAAGVTHVLVARKPTAASYPEALGRLLGDPAQARLVYQDDHTFLLRLRPGAW